LRGSSVLALDIILEILFWCDGTVDLYSIELNVDVDLLYRKAEKLEKKYNKKVTLK